jgi:RNA polymerase sigma-70 factor (ECF subfamily)
VIRAREDRWFEHFRDTGDPRMLAQVFDRTAPELGKVATHLSRDRHAAEDAVQSTFLAAIEAKHEWDAARPLLPWLLGLLVNRVRRLRRQQRSPEATRVTPPAGERDPKDLADASEVDGALRDALQRIPEPYRDTLERHLVHGLAAHEIADAIGVPAGTVRMRLHRGLDQLRQKLPPSLVMGGVLVSMPPGVFAAMRREVLATIPGGTEVGTASAGHFAVGWLGVIMMNKTLMTVLVASLVLVTSRWFLPTEFDPGALPTPAVATPGTTQLVADTRDPLATSAPDAARRAPDLQDAPAERGTLRISLHRADTIEPIERQRVDIVAGLPAGAKMADAGAKAFRVHGFTDADGLATFSLPPGMALVTHTFDPAVEPWQAEIKAGQNVDLVVTLPLRIDSQIEVVDEDGNPVARARIYAGTSKDTMFADAEVGHTDDAGCWQARFTESMVPIRAEHDGFACSSVVELGARDSSARLLLRRQHATLTGTVYTASGTPMAEAIVFLQSLGNGYRDRRPIPIRADAAGRYEYRHAPIGPFILVAAPEMASLGAGMVRADATIAAGQSLTVDLRFGTGPSLTVAVIDQGGRALAERRVAANLRPIDGLWQAMAVFGQLTATTDADGIAEFRGIATGIYSVNDMSSATDRATIVGVAPGADQHVTVTVRSRTWIEARIVDALDHPVVGWQVHLRPAIGGIVTTAETGAEGVVRFDDLPDQLHEVDVHAPKSKVPSLRRAVANGARTTLRVPDSALPTAYVRGTLALVTGMRPEQFHLTIVQRGQPLRILVAVNDDFTFASDGLPAGSYELLITRASDHSRLLHAPIPLELTAATTLDLGTIVLAKFLQMPVEVSVPEGTNRSGLFVAAALPAAPREFGHPPQSATGNTITVPNVPAGDYELLVWGMHLAPTIQSVSFFDGAGPSRIAARPGTSVEFALHGRQQGLVSIVLFRDGLEFLRLHTESRDLTLGFEPGNYRVEMNSSGMRGSAEFVVPTTGKTEPVTIRLSK